MTHSCVIGIDIGTGSIKAVATRLNGEAIDTAQAYYPSSGLPAGEQDPDLVFDAFGRCLAQIAGRQKGTVAAVALSSAMHSIIAVDENGKPLTNAWLWSDTRSGSMARELRSSAEGRALYRATGTPLHAMSPLCKIAWLKKNDPFVFEKAHKFISVKEYLWHRLFGLYQIDHSIASATGLFNVHTLSWEQAALDFAGISAALLSAPVPTGCQQSGLSSELSAAWSLPQGVPFCIGASDGCLANLGTLCLAPSTVAVTIGTSAAVRLTTDRPLPDDEKMIFNYRLNEERFVCGGAVNNGGNVMEWLTKTFATEASGQHYELLSGAAETIPTGCEGLLFLPYLYGERAPVWDEESCGVFFGIRHLHRQAHFIRAALEGVCFALNEILLPLDRFYGPINRIKLSGGGSGPFAQLLADATGKEVVTAESGDASAIGAAYLGLRSIGAITDFFALPEPTGKILTPNLQNREVYDRLFGIYKTLYPSLKEAMHRLRDVLAP